jgi:hypothetical protein
MFWISKFHNTPYKQGYVTGDGKYSTKPLSKLLTSIITTQNGSPDAGATLWNELPDASMIHAQTNLNQFKSLINNWNGNSCRS